jgi:hypothetical protein
MTSRRATFQVDCAPLRSAKFGMAWIFFRMDGEAAAFSGSPLVQFEVYPTCPFPSSFVEGSS